MKIYAVEEYIDYESYGVIELYYSEDEAESAAKFYSTEKDYDYFVKEYNLFDVFGEGRDDT